MSRNLWSDRPLGVKLSALVAAAALVLLVFAVITVQALQGAGERTEVLLATTHATEQALEADMMHDAVRGDVLQALLTGTGPQYQGAVTDLEEHGTTMRDMMAGIVAGNLGADVTAAVAEVEPAVDAYLASAQEIVTTAGQDPVLARTSYPAFLQAFEALEASLPSVGDAVGEHAAEAAQDSADQRATAITFALAVAGGGVLLLGALGWVVTRSVVRPLRRVSLVVAGLAEGDLRGTTGITSKDEVGRIAAALEVSMGTMRGVVSTIGSSANTLASATEELSATAAGMTRLAAESATQTEVVASTAGQVSGNVQTVAAGTDEMGASIREIAQNATDVAQVAGHAVGVASTATATVAKLGDSSLQIASVVKAITAIAEQTNLLALNATIEAARAGEAGKGFAVVANEVKELAQETAKATSDITSRVQGIQDDTQDAVKAISEIASIIARINDAQTTIAAAVEEQTATSSEMSRSVAAAASGVHQIAGSIDSVAESTGSTTRAVAEAQTAIDEAARLAADLSTAVARFRY